MKKFVKFVCGVATGAAAGFGAYCVYKNLVAKKNAEELDDFDDCFDEETDASDENREYVSINITEEEPASEEVEEVEEVVETEEVEEVTNEIK